MVISLKLQESVKLSADAWKSDLRELFLHAKDRFPDVVWEMKEDEDDGIMAENVWGHKGMIFFRRPPIMCLYFCLSFFKPLSTLVPLLAFRLAISLSLL